MLDDLREQRKSLFLKRQVKEKELEYAKTDEYVERMARDNFGLIYPGEYRYVAQQEVVQ